MEQDSAPPTPGPNGYNSPASESLLQNDMRDRIKKYFYQITRGCGDPGCRSQYCASNVAFQVKNSGASAALAVELARSGEGLLCTARIELAQLSEMVAQAQRSGDYSSLTLVVSLIFASPASLCRSFLAKTILPEDTSGITVDAEEARQALDLLTEVCSREPAVQASLHEALTKYLSQIQGMSTQMMQQAVDADPSVLNQFAVILELRLLIDPEYHDSILSGLALRISTLPDEGKSRLARFWSRIGPEGLHNLVGVMQQFVTMRLLHRQVSEEGYVPNKDQHVISAVKCLQILYEANEYTGHAVIPAKEFYNDAVNEHIDLRTDFPMWTTGNGFSFCQYPFILDPATKSEVLKVENIVKMRHEMQDAFFRAIFAGPQDPYLMLRIRREHLIRDALFQLSSKQKVDVKKQLRVQFIGEEGVDEGGVQKEFFQLVVREIFDPKYGMFHYDNEARLFWINPDSGHLGTEGEFELIGQILGLAIYNSVILDVHFPMVVYRKLMDRPVDLTDLKESHPSLGRGLQQLLEFQGDVEEVYQRTFQIEVDSFGVKTKVDLKPNGAMIPLTNANRHEYVQLYVDWVLNKSVEEQFRAFKRGFDNVASSNALKLFRPEEVELLVCGSPDLDFRALQQSTVYDGGYTKDTPVIQYFWSVVHDFTEDQKKKLLFFATGSDRVPIGGLAKLNFIIAKNGPDSDRLPTAHTCFNVLLLCEYSSLEKLRERLITAIQNAEGFGMI
eukprot:comp21004_c0_seq1/m.28191 comp21004_c0_seq1/g.28191  ORF comp21004_c0_seq1/g.28191 comp21004_c0_seq1/m.28191 type:complete len:730 (-) comp21004_c0_seq1:291-2480(-)